MTSDSPYFYGSPVESSADTLGFKRRVMLARALGGCRKPLYTCWTYIQDRFNNPNATAHCIRRHRISRQPLLWPSPQRKRGSGHLR